MRILVVGASGFIGRHLMRRLAGAGRQAVAGTFRSRVPDLDGNSWYRVELTDPSGLASVFAAVSPDVVVHLAALADVGTAEREPHRAAAVNVGGTSLVAGLTEQHRARLVYVSTEYVFRGDTGHYTEDATPQPTTVYGRTKLEAEREVAGICTNWSVLRTSIVYGWPEPGQRNFGPWLVDSLRNGRRYHGRTDVYRTPIYVQHLVDGIQALVSEHRVGTYHVAGKDWVSMYDFAHAIARAFDLDGDLVVPEGPEPGESDAGEPPRTAHGENADLLGLNSTHTMTVLGLRHHGLAGGVAAFRNDAPGV